MVCDYQKFTRFGTYSIYGNLSESLHLNDNNDNEVTQLYNRFFFLLQTGIVQLVILYHKHWPTEILEWRTSCVYWKERNLFVGAEGFKHSCIHRFWFPERYNDVKVAC